MPMPGAGAEKEGRARTSYSITAPQGPACILTPVYSSLNGTFHCTEQTCPPKWPHGFTQLPRYGPKGLSPFSRRIRCP